MSMARDRLEEEVNRIGVSTISTYLGVARNTVYNWLAKGNIPLTSLMALEGLGANLVYIVTGNRGGNTPPPGLTSEQELLLEAFDAMKPKKRKNLLASLLTGGDGGLDSKRDGVNVTGSGNRTAGRDYHEE